ncbi:MAG TPA: DUF2020 domain-containing protein [Mycobacteriales bacterium]|nr:DUF2020 domain-containing protein [Mycobacteriales bacterium]
MPRLFVVRTIVSLSSLCLLAGCGGSGAGPSPRNQAAGGPVTASGPPTGAQPTLPKTSARPTPTPSTVDAPCPYVDTASVMNTIGQHLTRTTVTSTVPHPSCAFYRPDGAVAAQITVSDLANPIAAQNAALAQVGKGSNPVSGIGDYGVVAIVDDGALLAVTKGPSLVLVKINQQSSLEAREIARTVVSAL